MPIILQRLKSVFQVKRAGSIIDCDHFDSMDSNFVGRTQGSGQGIHQQVLSQTLASSGLINSQPAKARHRNGVTRQTFAQVPWHMIKRYGTCRERIVAMYFIRARGTQGHKVLTDPCCLVLTRKATKMLIELRDAAVKGLAIMPLAQFLDRPGGISHLDDDSVRQRLATPRWARNLRKSVPGTPRGHGD